MCSDRHASGATPRRRNPRRLQPVPDSVLASLEALSSNGGRGDRDLKEVTIGAGLFIPEHGFRMLGDALRTNRHLQHLYIFNSFITTEGMQHVVDGLRHNRTLKSINAGENTMSARSVGLLIELLEVNPAITGLYLDWGATNSAAKRRISHLLHQDQRRALWLQLRGAVPRGALEQSAHHSGFRGANRKDSASSEAAVARPVAGAKRGRPPKTAAATSVRRNCSACVAVSGEVTGPGGWECRASLFLGYLSSPKGLLTPLLLPVDRPDP